MLQDVLAIAIALAATAWLAWTLRRRLKKPSCGPTAGTPPGTDGFVALDDLAARAKNRGDPKDRPDR
jgi:hypothetical protein